MKTRIFIIIGLLLLYLSNISNNKVVAQDGSTTENTLRIVCTPNLYDLTNTWAGEFCKLNPEVKIKVIKFTDAKLANILNVDANLYFVSNMTYTVLNNKDLWEIKVGEDALVPIINSKNPFLSEIKKHIISPEILAQILKKPGQRIWHVFPKTEKIVPINYYMVNDQSVKSMIAKFLSTKRTIDGIGVENDEKLISAINNDPYSIGFCKLSNLINSSNDENVSLMPVDRNENGKIDDFENIYTDLETFLNNPWFGAFPKELTENIYSVASQIPNSQTELAFLKYISTDGQQFLNQKGYSTLAYEEKQSNFKKLGYKKDFIATQNDSNLYTDSPYLFVVFILLLIFVGILMATSSKKKAITRITTNSPGVLDENSLIVPTGLYFDKTHTWAFMEKGGLVGTGIDDFLQHLVGPITRIMMKETGTKIKKGDPFLTIIQDGKQLTIKAPISGTIKSQNKKLISNSSLLNNSPYDQGWVYLIEPTNWLVEIQFLTMGRKYNEWLKKEFFRLKEFLAVFVKPDAHKYSLVLQDGGELKDGILVDLGPEIWEDFQTNFIDAFK